MTRSEIIDVFIVRAVPSGRQELRQKLDRMTKEELEEAYGVIQIQATEEKLLQIQAERAADHALHQYHVQQAREPQRRAEAEAQLAQDRQTFTDAAKTLRTFGVNEANFNVIRQTLGEGFSFYAVQQMVAANGATLSLPTQEELDEWTRQDIEAHNLRLLSMDIPTLRKLAREAGARGPAPVAPDETQRVRQAQRADGFAYPELPEEFREGNGPLEILDASFIKRCSRETYRLLMDRYGSTQITEALRSRVPGNSW
jgi:uncharacterized protein (DUF2252 family)